MSNNKEQQELDKIEAYMKDQIENYFPLKVKYFAVYDLVEDSLTGVFVTDTKKPYDFVIEKQDGLPVLKPHVPLQ